jgi:hypothetical protein
MRLVLEASTSASMHSFRSAIFRSSARTSRRISAANRRRTQAEAPCGRMLRTMRAARWVESVPGTPPGTRSRRSPWRRLSARVRSAACRANPRKRRRQCSQNARQSCWPCHSFHRADTYVLINEHMFLLHSVYTCMLVCQTSEWARIDLRRRSVSTCRVQEPSSYRVGYPYGQ